MTIKDFAEKTGLTISTIRYYDNLGLFPGLSRNSSGYRSFSPKDIEWALFINRLKETGMKIKDIVHYSLLRAEGDSTIPERMTILEEHKRELQKRIDRDNLNLEKMVEKIKIYKSLLP